MYNLEHIFINYTNNYWTYIEYSIYLVILDKYKVLDVNICISLSIQNLMGIFLLSVQYLIFDIGYFFK